MTTEDFIQFCEQQKSRNSADREEHESLSGLVKKLAQDVASIHDSRHATQENLAKVVNDMRLDHMTLEDQVASLAASIQSLVIALQGAYGGAGLITQVAGLKSELADIKLDFESIRSEGKGMARLIGWGAAAIGVAAAAVGILSLYKRS